GFELEGFAVREAADAAAGLRAAALQPLDLVILDLALPDLDGADVLERLRAWSAVPVIVLSVRSSEAEKVRLLEAGADDYVGKLRQKIEADPNRPRILLTELGVGYRLGLTTEAPEKVTA